MTETPRDLPHIYVPYRGTSENYTYPGGGGGKSIPTRERAQHANNLQSALDTAIQIARTERESRDEELISGEPGFYLDFEFQKSEKAEVIQKLGNKQQKIEVLAVTPVENQEDILKATVFVPDEKEDFFIKKIDDYKQRANKNGKPKNEALVARLESIHLSRVRSLFTDSAALFPENSQLLWWEVWFRKGKFSDFQEIAQKLNISIILDGLEFPERDVFLIYSSVEQLGTVLSHNDSIAELKISKETPSIFFEGEPSEQNQWSEALIENLETDESTFNISVCILDSGINRAHRLLEGALQQVDMHTCDPSWGIEDDRGHGTSMAGIALYGDLAQVLSGSTVYRQFHRLESVRILPPLPQENDPKMDGWLTKEAVSRVEIQEPERKRAICMAITRDDSNQGSPSSWSAAIDQICFGRDDIKRLFILTTGNIRSDIFAHEYLSRNDAETAENPSQSWNAIVVGAYTCKTQIHNSRYKLWQTIGVGEDLSPRSKTSVSWSRQWSHRPDIVLEGGNLATDGTCPGVDLDDLQLLTTYYQPLRRPFQLFGDTSAAAAICSYLSARVIAENPSFWPETVRGLLVHCARWTNSMLSCLPSNPNQSHKRILLRRYGYGVPELTTILKSAKNDFIMILQDELQPFEKGSGSNLKTKEMNIHELPWPREQLLALCEAQAQLKVTLSYFIEPNPGERGWVKRHSYASHGLRFSVKSSTETVDNFKKRISKALKEEGEPLHRPRDEGWFLGPRLRDNGSLHSDIWTGTAAELAEKESIGIYPVGGWWKENPSRDEWQDQVRYSLLVSLQIPDAEVDIYSPVENVIKQSVSIENEV